MRPIQRSLVVILVLALGAALAAEQNSVQKLLERGAFAEAVEKADPGDPEATYFAAEALLKMKDNGAATERYGQLRESTNDAWKAIGESGAALLSGNVGGAFEAATRAVETDGDNAFAHYQLGLVLSRQGNYQRAATELVRAIEIKPDLAYAHYYAGLAFNRIKNIPKMSEHLNTFLKLAPDAPERQTVAAMLRGLR